ncbi:hypothetical protein C8R44DRAFT_863758 [Mycena epipterygia]|nr:hypothetical protein C8R44DRAFT_863758 [Mycena epipterygia]
MAPGRPPLDPDVKQQRLEESRRRYEQKNIAKRREEARLRMKKRRAVIAASDTLTKRKYAQKNADAADRYRFRKREENRAEQRAADTERKRRRAAEAQALLKKHKQAKKPPLHTTVRKPVANAPQPITEPSAVANPPVRPQRCLHCYAEDCIGCQGNSASLERMLKCYPRARTWEAAPWSTFHRMWDLDCTEYHDHGSHPSAMIAITPDSSVPSSPSSLTDSTTSRHPSPPPPRLPIPVTSPSHSSAPRATASSLPGSPAKSKITKEELAFLSSFRPGPGPISPQRLSLQFARVLGPQAVVPSSTQPACEDAPATSLETRASSLRIGAETVEATLRAGGRICVKKAPAPVEQREAPHTPPRALRADLEHAARSPRAARTGHEQLQRQPSADPILYVVSGHNRVFQKRKRAMAVFHGSPGAELLFTRDENEAFDFFEEDFGNMKI